MACLLTGLALVPGLPDAATTTATMAVTATVVASCSISAAALAFGNYTSAAVDAVATISVTCSTGTTYDIELDAGTASGATTATRAMQNGSNTLSYNIYSNSGRSTVWGLTTDKVSGTGTGSAQSLSAYGRIPAGQSVAAGSYSDTITATITY